MTTEERQPQMNVEPQRGIYLEAYQYLLEHGKESADMIFRHPSKREEVYADFFVLRLFCGDIPFVMEGDKKVVRVPDGLQIEAIQTFIQAIYLGKINNLSFATLLQVRDLGVFCNCVDVHRQCDEYETHAEGLTEDNCHVALQEWPVGSPMCEKALEFMIKNLRTLVVENKRSVRWKSESWVAVLECCHEQEHMPLTKEELYEGIRRWRRFDENVNDDDDGFVEICKLMDKQFLYEVVYPKSLLHESLLFQILAYHDGQRLTKLDKSFWVNKDPVAEEDVENVPPPPPAPQPLPTSAPNPVAAARETSRNSSSSAKRRRIPSNDTSSQSNSNDSRPGCKKVAQGTGSASSSRKSVTKSSVHAGAAKIVVETQTPSVPRMPIPQVKLIRHSKNQGYVIKTPAGRLVSDSNTVVAIASTSSTITSTSPKKEARNYAEFMVILQTVQAGDHILLKEGEFVGQVRLKLPDRVTISGMGSATIVSDPANDFVWDIVEGNHCVIEKIHFKKGFRHPRQNPGNNRRRGMWVCTPQFTLRKCIFSHCCLEIARCTDSTFSELTFESFYYGIIVAPEASNVSISDVTFRGVKVGIDCWAAHDVTMRDVKMSRVDIGVVIQGDGSTSTNGCGNTLSNMKYHFNPTETSYHQIAVEISACSNNTVERVECLDYVPIESTKKGRKVSTKGDRYGLRILNNHDIIARENIVKKVTGAPIVVCGEANVFLDLLCPSLEVTGNNHQFSNCHAKVFNRGPNSTLTKTENCNFQ